MKKIILTVLALTAFTAINAFADYKWYVSGNLGYNSNDTKNSDKTSGFGLGATLGYIINDKSDVSIGIDYSSVSRETIGSSDESFNDTKISLGYEYLLASKGDFYFYLWGGFSYTLISSEDKLSNDKWEGQSYGISIVPNVQYAVTERIVVGFDLNFLSLDYYVTTGDNSYENTEFGINANTTASSPVTLYFSYLF